MNENRRQLFRIKLEVPLAAHMKIIGTGSLSLPTKECSVLIPDISAGGVRVHSKVDLPENLPLLLEFRLTLLNHQFRILGTCVRKIAQNSVFDYGILFILNDNELEKLTGTLNMLSVRLKKVKTPASCSFCTEEELQQFYGDGSSVPE